MDRTIRNRLIGRLALTAVLLAMVSGVAAFSLELRKVDNFVLSLAVRESEAMMEHVSFLSSNDREVYETVRRQVERHIREEHVMRGQFIIIELHDKKKQKIIEAAHPDYEGLVRTIDWTPHGDLLTDTVTYRKHMIDSVMYIQVFAPLVYASGEIIGYLEGIHRVDPPAVRTIRRGPMMAVLQVVIIVFATTFAVYPVILMLNRDTGRLQGDLTAANVWMLEMLGNAVDKRDRETGKHNYRVAISAAYLGEAAGMRRSEIQDLMKGAFLHDVGKIGIADSILHKPAQLTGGEHEEMRTHVQHGVDIIGRYAWLRGALDVIRYHHEKYDGTGYLAGLKGKSIPLAARIFTIVDVFDALTSKRPYKEAGSLEETLRTMMRERGSRFDPDLLDVFIGIAPRVFTEVSLAGEDRLEEILDGLQRKYFSAP